MQPEANAAVRRGTSVHEHRAKAHDSLHAALVCSPAGSDAEIPVFAPIVQINLSARNRGYLNPSGPTRLRALRADARGRRGQGRSRALWVSVPVGFFLESPLCSAGIRRGQMEGVQPGEQSWPFDSQAPDDGAEYARMLSRS